MKKIMLLFIGMFFRIALLLYSKIKSLFVDISSFKGVKVYGISIPVKVRIVVDTNYISREELTQQYSRLPFVDLFSNPPGFSIFNVIPINTN